MEFINQYSFTLMAGVVLVLFAAFVFRKGIGQRQVSAMIALLLGFLIAYWLFSPGEGSNAGVDRAERTIGSGTPVLIEFQSPY